MSLTVVILGGGFGGLAACAALAKAKVHVTLVDRRNHHLFQPLLYQVATAGLSAPDIAAPLRWVLRRQANATVILDEALRIDRPRKTVVLRQGELAYDILIVATGSSHTYFGRDEWAPFAPGLKTLDDALTIRRRMLLAFERAERAAAGSAERLANLTFAVIGGGPTGVELAGTIAEVARTTLAQDFRSIDPHATRVILLEGGPRILAAFPPSLSESAARQLAALGVEVRATAKVTAIDAEGLSIGTERIPARTIIWAAGVIASPLARSLDTPLDRAGRALVGTDLRLPGCEDVYVIGDLMALEQDGKPIPGLAPAAIQAGRCCAQNIIRGQAAQPPLPFRYKDRGAMATIGRKAGIALIGGREFSGFPAWLAWLLIHLYFLIGFRNRLVVLFSWAWAYLTFQRGARLIFERDPDHQG